MNHVSELHMLETREAQALQTIEQVRKQRREVIKQMRLEARDRSLNRKTVAALLEYNYSYMSRLDIPFKGKAITYLELLEWIDQYQPSRRAKLEANYNEMFPHASLR